MTAPTPPDLPLTAEQQRIVAHTFGHASVFAVAGSGKTTTIAYRVERLIREGHVPAARILCATFGKDAQGVLHDRLARWPHCAAVKTSTLHALGLGIITLAQRMNLGTFTVADTPQVKELYFAALGSMNRDPDWRRHTSDLTEEEFDTFAEVMKGNLRYADLAGAALPAGARGLATQANETHGAPAYLELYRRFEALRRARGWLTFPDMIVTAWELMLRHGELRAAVAGRYDVVIVDEFQDVNLAQSEVLHLIAAGCRSYMAVGDDDQTIYSWRGSATRFILDFPARYAAQRYLITANFRSCGAVLAVANAVIHGNERREAKRLNLTRDFSGTVTLHTAGQQSANVLATVQRTLQTRPAEDLMILVRRYGQTPPLEEALLTAGVPYAVIGSVPFWRRKEIAPLVAYLRLATFETRLQVGEALSAADLSEMEQAWMRVYNAPTRFLKRDDATQIFARVRRGQTLLSAVCADPAPNSWGLTQFGAQLRALMQALTDPDGALALTEFIALIKYEEHLSRTAGLTEVGAERREAVETFVRMVGERTLPAFLTHLDALAALAQRTQDDARGAVRLMTAFRAKGLEWPVVLIPDCDGDTYRPGQGGDPEEERRVFYVALTRARDELHLFCQPVAAHQAERGQAVTLTPFLDAPDVQAALDAARTLQQLLGVDPRGWTAADRFAFMTAMNTAGFHDWLRRAGPQGQAAAAAVAEALSVARAGWAALGLADSAALDAQVRLWPLHTASDAAAVGETPAAPVGPLPDRPGPAFWVRHETFGVGPVVAMRTVRTGLEVVVTFGRRRRVLRPDMPGWVMVDAPAT